MHQLINFLTKKALSISVYILAGLILIAGGVFFSYHFLHKAHEKEVNKALRIEPFINRLQSNLPTIDLLGKDAIIDRNQVDLNAYSKLLETVELALDSLKYNSHKEKISRELIALVEGDIISVLSPHRDFIAALQSGDSSSIESEFIELPIAQETAMSSLDNLRLSLADQVNASRSATKFTSRFMEYIIVIILFGVPLLIWTGITLKKDRKTITSLNRAIQESNERYVFNSNEPVDFENAEQIKTALLTNLKKAADFIKSISNGNYDVQWEGMDDSNRELNKDNIAGELILMREQMKLVKEQDEARIWATEGLSKFGEIIRKQQDDFGSLADTLISNVVKYVKAKVGGLFILEEEEDGSSHLQLQACYAYDRKKFISKRLEVGEGLVGQAYLEGQSVYLTEVPDEYMIITSGLGDTSPRSLLIIPLRTNERIEGILELASLNEFKPYEIEFLEKLGETLASSIVSVRTAEKTKILLQISQEQSEEMRAQEEEMRQNMEEIEATQEQMARHVSELNLVKENLEKEKYLFNALMDNLPDAIYFKDTESKFIRVSKYLADHFNASVDDLIGKSDFDFQDKEHATEAYNDEQFIIKSRKGKYDFVEKEIRADGSAHYVSTTKLPLINLQGKVVGTFGVSRDVTKMKLLEIEAEEKTKKLREEEKEFGERIAKLEANIQAKENELKELRKK